MLGTADCLLIYVLLRPQSGVLLATVPVNVDAIAFWMVWDAQKAVHQTPGETRHQPIHALRRLEQDSATIGTRVLTVERGNEGLVEEIRGG